MLSGGQETSPRSGRFSAFFRLDTVTKKPQNPGKRAWGARSSRMGAKALIVGFCALALAGCASAPPSPEALAANDPYEQTNRQTLKLNGKIDKYFVIHTVGVYFL